MHIDKDEMHSNNTPQPSSQSDIAARYRITSLVRRRPGIQLSFAFDIQLQNLVMLRDIDVSGLDETARKLAYAELQQEHELLEHQHIADLTPLIASRSSEGHIYSIAGWPFSLSEEAAPIRMIRSSRPYTLHDLLQSGVGLPKEQIAISWIRGLALAVERLHECQIIIGELDPDTIIISSYDYSGQPALIVSWIPTRVRHTLSRISNTVYPSNFRAPETLDGRQDGLTDIYSLGALLYLLLTGIAPDPVGSSNASRYRQRTPRDLNPHISSALATIVMQAMALDPDKRFHHASELEEALHYLQKDVHIFRLPQITFVRPPKSTPKFGEETPVSFARDNNENSVSKEAQLVEEPNDKTIQMRDIQEQLARSYLSRINTGPLISQEKQTGEATVDKVSIQEKQTEDVVEDKVILDQGLEEMPTSKNKQIKKGKKRSSRKYQVSDESSLAEVQAKTIEIAESSVQVVTASEESSNEMPFQEVAIDTPTEEVCIVSLREREEVIESAEEVREREEAIDSAEEVREREVRESVEEVIESAEEVRESVEEVREREEVIASEEEVTSKQEAVYIEKVAGQQKKASGEEYVVPISRALQPQSISRSDMLPVISPGRSKERALARIKDLFIATRSLLTPQIQPTEANKDESFLRRIQRFIVGEQTHSTMAVALIEMPMRIQPTQGYAIRIQIIGRDQQTNETQTGGLSALTYKDIVHIEVRLALYRSYAYMVQQADVAIPASGYAAEVVVPMLPLASGPSSRRERLQIFFMDKDRNPLYERPFVIEIFVSLFVQLGNEGHSVLSIPM